MCAKWHKLAIYEDLCKEAVNYGRNHIQRRRVSQTNEQ